MADLGDRVDVVLVQPELRVHRPGPCGEELDGVVPVGTAFRVPMVT